jgi:hypothetical protein
MLHQVRIAATTGPILATWQLQYGHASFAVAAEPRENGRKDKSIHESSEGEGKDRQPRHVLPAAITSNLTRNRDLLHDVGSGGKNYKKEGSEIPRHTDYKKHEQEEDVRVLMPWSPATVREYWNAKK